MKRPGAVFACALALTLAGCQVEDPSTRGQAPVDRAQPGSRTDAERPTVPADAGGGGATRAALERFARSWANWSFRSLARSRRELATQAAGRLHRSLLEDAQRAADDAALRDSNSSNEGTVAGIVLRGTEPALVVTLETAHVENGGSQAGYFVYLARAQRGPSGWKVVTWEPVS
jgi:hypothetical protein